MKLWDFQNQNNILKRVSSNYHILYCLIFCNTSVEFVFFNSYVSKLVGVR